MKLRYLFIIFSILLYCTAGFTKPQKGVCTKLQSHPEWMNALKKTEQKWGVPIPVQLSIIRHESNFKAMAKNPHSTAFGYPQALNKTWRYYQSAGNKGAKRTDFSAATDFIGWYADQMHESLGIPKDDAFKLYVAYHDGSGAYKKTIKRKHSATKRLARKVNSTASRYEKELLRCV